MNINRKRGRITLEGMYPWAKYMGAAFIALSIPRMPGSIWLIPGITGSRLWLMAWVVLLLGAAILMDRAWLKAYTKDVYEIRHNIKNGNLNRSTLLAIGVPLMFIADIGAIVHMYFCLYRSGMAVQAGSTVTAATVLMAAGMVLWIYGQLLPRIPFGSIWGIRTKQSLSDTAAWGQVHLSCVKWFCLAGAVLMLAGLFI
ncbi:MAG: hypothetical protein Q4C54_10640 [Clostridia bacterium]|nr:hypothetical protein [Clostridia bacterium]